jgi:hypothetical protein
VSGPISKTIFVGPCCHSTEISCWPGSTPASPGFVILSGSAILIASTPNDDSGRKFTYKVSASGAIIKSSIRCLSNKTGPVNGVFNELEFVPAQKTITVAPGAVVDEVLTCPQGYKGIVAGWDYDKRRCRSATTRSLSAGSSGAGTRPASTGMRRFTCPA